MLPGTPPQDSMFGGDFEQTFKLSEYMNVKNAKLKDGMLNITLVQELPKEKQPKEIKIN